MSKKESFENVYKSLQNKKTNETDEILKKAKKEKLTKNIWTLIVCIIVDKIFIDKFALILLNEARELIIFIIASIFILDMIIFIIFSLIFSKNQKLANKAFKELAIKDMICNFYDDVDYVPDGKMPQGIYKEAKYNEYYDIYYSDDYIEATIKNKYPIKIAEVETQEEKTETDSDGQTTTTISTIFRGLFAKITIDKSIDNQLTVGTRRSFCKGKQIRNGLCRI